MVQAFQFQLGGLENDECFRDEAARQAVILGDQLPDVAGADVVNVAVGPGTAPGQMLRGAPRERDFYAVTTIPASGTAALSG